MPVVDQEDQKPQNEKPSLSSLIALQTPTGSWDPSSQALLSSYFINGVFPASTDTVAALSETVREQAWTTLVVVYLL